MSAADRGAGPPLRERYARAERYLSWNVPRLVSRTDVVPRWLSGGEHLWYRVRTPEGWEHVLVDPRRRTRAAAFDAGRLAAAAHRSSGRQHPPGDLPVDDLRVAGRAVEASLGGRWYRCDGDDVTDAGPALAADELVSPDGRRAVSERDGDLWVRDLATGEERALTTDGAPHAGYGTRPEFSVVDGSGEPAVLPPAAVWSPDSRCLLTHHLDERLVGSMHLVRAVPPDGSRRPGLVSVRSAVAGDEHLPLVRPLVLDVETASTVPVATAPVEAAAFSPVDAGQWWWGADGRQVWLLRTERGDRSVDLLRVDPATGAAEVVLTETSQTYVDLAAARWPAAVRVLEGSGDVLLWSERDGWGHLHLFDAAGRPRRQLTRGEWVVRELVHVDEAAGQVWFTAGGREPGRDPYLRHLYRVPLAGGEPELLTPEDADHLVVASPDGAFAVDVQSSPAAGTTAVLRSAGGEVLMVLEESDTGGAEAVGWRPPEHVRVTARDGVSELHGMVVVPTDFDPARRYPVVDLAYPGSHRIHVPKRLSLERPDASLWEAQSLAELGLVVVLLDGLGTAFRSKAFHDEVQGSRFGEGGGLQDHVGGLRQLAADRPWMDLDRVGIVGGSWGGYWAARGVLCHGDVFSVAVAGSGNHDPWRDNAWFAERYLGPVETARRPEHANSTFADQLTGHLLLVQGELEAHHCHPAYALELVRALVRADKDVDLLVVPDGDHRAACGDHPYVARRTWDYLVTHLLGESPPPGYRITRPGPETAR